MAEVKWIKICTDIFDDEKILLLESMPEADGLIVIWFKLLCLAGKQNNSGVFLLNDRIAYTEDMLATVFRRPVNTVRLALSVFEQYGMIEVINGVITIPKWDKHQSLDAYEKRKERDRLYQQRKREEQRLLVRQSADESSDTSSDIGSVDKIRLEEDKIRLDKSNNNAHSVRFKPPTVEEVAAYCQERGNNVDPQQFVDHYESNGWMRGKNKIKDWRACVRTWERDSNGKPKKIITAAEAAPHRSMTSQSDLDYLNDILRRVKGGG